MPDKVEYKALGELSNKNHDANEKLLSNLGKANKHNAMLDKVSIDLLNNLAAKGYSIKDAREILHRACVTMDTMLK